MVNALDELEKGAACLNHRIIKKSLKWFFSLLIFAFFFSCGSSPDESYLVFRLVWPPELAVQDSNPIPNQQPIKSSGNQLYVPQADYLGVLNIRASLWDSNGLEKQVEHAYSLHEGRMKSDPGTFLLRVEGLDSGNNVIYRGEVTSVVLVKGKATDAGDVLMQAINPIPDSPSSLQATVLSSSQIILTWTDNSDNESGFKIERKEGTGGSWAEIKDISSNTANYTDAGLACETTYYYRVKSYNDEGNSDYSNESNAKTQTCPTSIPSAPSNPQAAVVSASEINLSWTDNSNNEDGFKIERKVEGGTYSQFGAVGSGVTAYHDTGLTCETRYFYRITSYNGLGDSGYSTEINTITSTCPTSAPTAPSGLTATIVSNTQIDLDWTDKSNNEDVFKIERKTGSGGTYSQVGTVGAGVVFYPDGGLTCGTTYYYRVRATNSVGDSGYSNEILNKTSACPLTPPSVPSNLQATAISSSQINLTWTDNSGNEDGFKIERKTGSGGTYGQIGTVGGGVVAYSDTGLTCGSTYYYRVRAYNTVGDSSYTSEANGVLTCPLTVPMAPSNLQATVVSSSQINLSWTDNSSNEDGFKIERKEGVGGTYIIVFTASANASSWANTGLSANTTYYFRIYAYNSVGNSSYSNEVYSTTQSAPPTGMTSIPAGCFNMGDAFNEGESGELPVHNICISTFQMSIYEVTNKQYKTCVDAGSCTAPSSSLSYSRSSYYGNSTYDNYPVIYVNWSQAKVFCEWIGGRLPTEAEWEYAARGGLSGKRFPWGDTIDCTKAYYYSSTSYSYDTQGSTGYCAGNRDTTQVGSYAANGCGLYDMAGNVWEWVNDWYDGSYYSTSPTQDPTGPSSGSEPVLRGGSWSNLGTYLRAAYREGNPPAYQGNTVGFRCAK